MSGYRLWKKCDSVLPVETQISIHPHHYPLHQIMEQSLVVGLQQKSHKECWSCRDYQNNCGSSHWVRADRKNKPTGDGKQDDAW